MQEQSSHLKWLEERERKKEEVQQVLKQQLLRERPSPSKISHSESNESNVVNSPSLTDQLNIDVTSNEIREPSAEVKIGTNIGIVSATPTPSSPLLTSLLRSPSSSSGPSSASKTLSSSVPTKLNFSLC